METLSVSHVLVLGVGGKDRIKKMKSGRRVHFKKMKSKTMEDANGIDDDCM
jgi:hypothetical protein